MSFINKFRDATIGFSGYARLLRDRTGGFGYVALLLAIVLAASAVINTVKFSREMAVAKQELAAGPDFGFRNGEVYFDGPMPYTMGDETTTIIIDTTGQTTVDAIRQAGSNSMLVTKDKLYQVKGFGQIQETDLSPMAGFDLSKENVLSFMDGMVYFIPIGYLFIYVFQLGFKALDAVILALVALLYGSIAKREVPFALGFKTGLYAMTLSIVLQWIPIIPGFSTLNRYGFLTWWGLAILFTIMGLRAYFATEDAESEAFYPGGPQA